MHIRNLILALALAGVSTAASAAPITRYTTPATPGAPPAIILQGVLVPAGADTLYLSGQLASPVDPAKMSTPPAMADFGDTKTQTMSVLGKIKSILISRGYAMSDVVKMTVFLAGDPAKGGKLDAAGMNDAFKTFFGTAENPNTVARSTVQVANLVGPQFLVEIEVIAAKAK